VERCKTRLFESDFIHPSHQQFTMADAKSSFIVMECVTLKLTSCCIHVIKKGTTETDLTIIIIVLLLFLLLCWVISFLCYAASPTDLQYLCLKA
jgi:hypothetical protein